MTKSTLIISDTKDCRIEVTHRDSDPAMWIVRCWKAARWRRKRVSSDWFTDREQAITFAKERGYRMMSAGAGLPRNVRVSAGSTGLHEEPT